MKMSRIGGGNNSDVKIGEHIGKSKATSMLHYMPEIIWHDRVSLLSVDFQKPANDQASAVYKLVTCSLQMEVRIWKMDFRMLKIGTEDLGIQFIANLVGHRTTVNVGRFSPDGELLVSGDCDGCLIIWKIDDAVPNLSLRQADDFPSNIENWVRYKTTLSHKSDICSLCWSPDSHRFAAASRDESVAVYEANSGCRLWYLKCFRRFPNGVVWDPRGKYVITMSTDRKMDILCAQKGSCLRCIQNILLPDSTVGKTKLNGGVYKLFHDDQLMSFTRSAEFSPKGELLFAPSGKLETVSSCVFGTFIFRRCDLKKGRPVAFIPSSKASFRVVSCPVLFKLRSQCNRNALGLPYRVVWAVLTKDSVSLFDSQLCRCIGYVTDLQYDALTDLSWSSDGRVLMISSLEGYISFIRFGERALGEKYTGQIPEFPPSPQLVQKKKRPSRRDSRGRKVSENSAAKLNKKPKEPEKSPPNSLLKYFKRIETSQRKDVGDDADKSPKSETKKTQSDELTSRSESAKKNVVEPSGCKSKPVEKRRPDANDSSSDKESDSRAGTGDKKPNKKRAKLLSSKLE